MTDETAPEREAALLAVLHRRIRSAAEADGRSLAVATLSVDFGPISGEPLPTEATAQVDRSTRSLVFASGEVRDETGALLAAGSGVYRVIEAG